MTQLTSYDDNEVLVFANRSVLDHLDWMWEQ